MRWKTVAFLVLLVFTVSAFLVTSSQPEAFEALQSLDLIGFFTAFGRPVFALCDPIPGGPGGPT